MFHQSSFYFSKVRWECPGRKCPRPVRNLFCVAGVGRVTSIKVLGGIVNDNLRATDYVAELISSCSRGLYALRLVRWHGLFDGSLHGVTKPTVVARLQLYACLLGGVSPRLKPGTSSNNS